MAKLERHLTSNQEIAGSSPVGGTTIYSNYISLVVQWLGFVAFTDKAGVQFPVREIFFNPPWSSGKDMSLSPTRPGFDSPWRSIKQTFQQLIMNTDLNSAAI